MKILVAIANYGLKNQAYLQKLIDEYKSMNYSVDIVVLSNIPKELDPDIEVIVGLPAKNPWSLPFTHKRIFAERSRDYDLFIYSEDDILVKQKNIEAFLRVQAILPDDEIAGFLRYEENPIDPTLPVSMPDIHAYYHWLPNSVKSYGENVFAFFSNEHSACYILTRKQLHKAIESGGYLVNPHEGRYDMLCTAATDPYTQCGFTKVICISQIQDFLVHHLSNVYVGKTGIESSEFELQLNALLATNNNSRSRDTLFQTQTLLNTAKWDKLYYETCSNDVLELIPTHSKNVLSVGCGWGATEVELIKRGMRVVGIPLDSVIVESLKSRGIEVVYPDFDRANDVLKKEKFDCILFNNVLQYLSEPVKILKEYIKLLEKEGHVVVNIPNFKYAKYLYEILKKEELHKLKDGFDKTNLHRTVPKLVNKWFVQSGLKVVNAKYNINNRFRNLVNMSLGLLKEYFAYEVVFAAKPS